MNYTYKYVLQGLLFFCFLRAISSPFPIESAHSQSYTLDDLLLFNSEKELMAAFPDQVTRATAYGPEGIDEFTISILYADTNDQVEFYWEDDSVYFNKLLYIKLYGEQSNWKTKEGIGLGTPVDQLEALNKKPFIFYGLEWDYSGAIDWQGGALEARGIYASLTAPMNALPPNYDQLIGEKQIASNSNLGKNSGLIVGELVMVKSNTP